MFIALKEEEEKHHSSCKITCLAYVSLSHVISLSKFAAIFFLSIFFKSGVFKDIKLPAHDKNATTQTFYPILTHLSIAERLAVKMEDVPQPDAFLQPNYKSETENPTSTKPKPLTPKTFTGMVNTSDAATERRFKGTFNVFGGSSLYNRRLEANLALSREGNGGYAAWNRRRQEAIDRGEDPNAEFIAKVEARQPDSYLERIWRKLQKVIHSRAKAGNGGDLGAAEVYQGLGNRKADQL